jgi:hypothetical protein
VTLTAANLALIEAKEEGKAISSVDNKHYLNPSSA